MQRLDPEKLLWTVEPQKEIGFKNSKISKSACVLSKKSNNQCTASFSFMLPIIATLKPCRLPFISI